MRTVLIRRPSYLSVTIVCGSQFEQFGIARAVTKELMQMQICHWGGNQLIIHRALPSQPFVSITLFPGLIWFAPMWMDRPKKKEKKINNPI